MENTDAMMAAFAPQALDAAMRAVFWMGLAQAIGAVVLIAVGGLCMRIAFVVDDDVAIFPAMGLIFSWLLAIFLLLLPSTWLPLIDPAAAVASRFLH